MKLRFLHLQLRSMNPSSPVSTGSLPNGWQEAVEREVSLPELVLGKLTHESVRHVFVYPYQKQIVSEAAGCGETMARVERRQEAIEGAIDVSATRVGESLFKVSVHVQNLTPMEIPAADRNAALMHSLVSTHMI